MPISVSRYAPVKCTNTGLEVVLWEDVTWEEKSYPDHRTANVVMVEYRDLMEAQRLLGAAAQKCPDLAPRIKALFDRGNF